MQNFYGIIKIHHECKGGIEKYVQRITDWHQEVCLICTELVLPVLLGGDITVIIKLACFTARFYQDVGLVYLPFNDDSFNV